MKTAIQTEPWSAADRKLAERVRRKFRAGVREFRLLEPGEVVERACGPFDPTVYTDYLEDKYRRLYGLK